ncbi:solute carrier family 23 member 1-like isoform X1 [Cherax quadricarinatus]|uniref:solute carrier family 23 member 1-like isoform X1 n=2 Tax=Cherax quadricarinatus TaxID=27406 RepID=UPI00387EADD1
MDIWGSGPPAATAWLTRQVPEEPGSWPGSESNETLETLQVKVARSNMSTPAGKLKYSPSLENMTASENDSHDTSKLSDNKKHEPLLNEETGDIDLIYTLEETPPWYICIFFGFQHYLTMAGGTVVIPIIVASFLCMPEDESARGALVSTVFFHSGLVTLLQTTFGVRLPIIQGGDFAYVVPTIALLTTVYEPCDALPLANLTAAARQEVWQVRLRDIQGSIAVASVFQIILGFTGIIGIVLRWITPLSVVPTVTLVGLSLFDVAATKAAQHWGISILTIALILLFSQYMSTVPLPVPVLTKDCRFKLAKSQVFKCFPVLLAVLVSWTLCAILTTYDLLPEGSPARADATRGLLQKSPWFRIPYPGQWGWPSVRAAGVVGMLGGAVASIIESIGDYYVCAKITGAPPPPVSAINRGVGVEGVGCLLAGLIGTGNGTTSCSQNIGVISVTKVGSRRVVQYSAIILIFSGVFAKFGAVFITIPEPVMAGVFVVMFAMVTSVGLSPLQYVDLASSRNLFVIGFSIFFGMAVPKWVEKNPGIIQTGSAEVDQILTVLLQTPMFIGGGLGFLFDNTIPGTAKERGLLGWNKHYRQQDGYLPQDPDSGCCHPSSSYDMPFGMKVISRIKWLRYLPFSPTFNDFRSSKTEMTVNGVEEANLKLRVSTPPIPDFEHLKPQCSSYGTTEADYLSCLV